MGRHRQRLERQPLFSASPEPESSGFEGRGQAIPEPARSSLESSFDHSFSKIRIHDNQQAHRAATAEGAAAFAVGEDVVFGPGQFKPDTPRGRHLLAHELAHVVQQRGAGPARPGARSTPAAEGEARGAADVAALGGRITLPAGSVGAGTLAAQEAAAAETEAQRLERIVGQFPFMASMFPGWAFTAGSGGVKATKSDGMTAVTRSADVTVAGGFGAEVGQRRVTDADPNHQMESAQKAGWQGGAGFFESMSGGKWLADDGTKRGEQSTSRVMVGPDKLGAKSTQSTTEDTVTKTRSMEASREDGKYNVALDFSRDFALDDDHKMGRSTGIKAGSDGGSVERATTSRIKDVETGAIESDDRRTSAGWSAEKGWSGQYSKNQTTEIGGEKFGKQSSAAVSTSGIDLATSRSQTGPDADGNDATTTNSRGVAVGFDGKVTYSAGSKDAKGNTTGYSLGGSLDPSNLSVESSFSRNGWKVSGKAGRQVAASDPRAVGDQWAVDWTEVVSASGGGGAKGVGVSGGFSSANSGTRLFKSREEADAFKESASLILDVPYRDPTSVTGALFLGIGESRGAGTSSTAGIEVSASPTAGSIGVGASSEDSSSFMVTRLSPTVFELTFKEGAKDSKSLSASTLGIGATRHSADTSGTQRTVQIDIGTDVGRKAFETFTKEDGTVAPGARVISESMMSGHQSGQTFGGPGFSSDWSGFTEEEVTRNQRGKTERYSGGTSSAFESRIPWAAGHDKMTVRLDQTETNDADSNYVMRGSVDSTEGRDSATNLAKITGTAGRDFSKATPSGKWGVEMELTEEIVEHFLGNIGEERIRQMGLLDSDARNDLRERLRDAKTSDDRKRALAHFFADAGVQGNAIEAIRNNVFGAPERFHQVPYEQMKRREGANFFYDLTLPGDDNFRGIGARKELEAKIAQFDVVIRESPDAAGTVHDAIMATLRELRRQRREVADPTRYTDLPDELRENQVGRLDMYIGQLEGQQQQTGVAYTSHEAEQVEAQLPGAGARGHLGGVKKVRYDLGMADKDIASAKGFFTESNKSYQEWYHKAMRGTGSLPADLAAGVREASHLWSVANRFKEEATASEPATNQARSEYIQATDPEWAIQVGSAALGQLTQTKAAWEKAWFGMVEAEGAIKTAVETQ